MSSTIHALSVLVEGFIDEAVVRRILEYVGIPCGPVFGKSGRADLLRKLPNYNHAAHHQPWLVVVDLDDTDCAPLLVREALPSPAPLMQVRVAVREIEAWLLGDTEQLATFLAVSEAKLPRNPDTEANPKRTLVNLARRSRNREIREDMVPRLGKSGRVGPGYTDRIVEFALEHWRPDVAATRSDSLRRCLERLNHLANEGSFG